MIVDSDSYKQVFTLPTYLKPVFITREPTISPFSHSLYIYTLYVPLNNKSNTVLSLENYFVNTLTTHITNTKQVLPIFNKRLIHFIKDKNIDAIDLTIDEWNALFTYGYLPEPYHDNQPIETLYHDTSQVKAFIDPSNPHNVLIGTSKMI
uniref:Uncharacterized protein n=1 Tax=viral metagenome TaxID=1070528 RepID=A0A6C0JC62_9ZZZZ